MKLHIVVVLVFLLMIGNSHLLKGNGPYYFEKLSPEAGFAFDAVYAISEDCNGFIWFGCNNGLYYYNTTEIFKVNLLPQKQNVSQSLKITNILHDNQCGLWVCAEEGLFKRNESNNSFNKLSFYSKDSVYSTDNDVTQILEFKEGLYFLIIKGNIFYFDENEGILHELKFEQKGNSSTSYVGKDKRGNILIGTSDGKVFTGTHPFHTFQLFYGSTGSSAVKSICDDNNKYYIGFEGYGVEVVNSVGDIIFTLNDTMEGKYHLPDNRVRNIIKTDDGEIWIGTYQGIVVLDGNSNTIITNGMYNGLPQKSIYVLHKGKNGGIWIGTWAGGIAYYHKDIYRFNHIVKVPDEKETKSVISSFVEDNEGNIWIGSEQAGIKVYDLNTSKFLENTHAGLERIPKSIKSLININDKKIVVGTFYKGIWLYDLEKDQSLNISLNSILDSSIISTMAALDNKLWIGSRGAKHSLFKYDFETETYEAYDIAGENSKKNFLRVWKLLVDSSLRLWVCTDEGLFYKYKNDLNFKKCFDSDSVYGLGETMFYTVYEDHDEKLWIGTKGKGLFSYDPTTNSLELVTKDSYSSGTDVFGIVEDKLNNIWFSTDRGVFQFEKGEQVITKYTEVDGLPGDQFIPNAIMKGEKGELFFGSSNGFSFINPKSIQFNTTKPRIFLTKLLVNNKHYNLSSKEEANLFIVDEIKKIVLKPHENSLTFGVATNNFIKPHKNRFKYRLVKYDEDWIEVEHERDITYTKIPPGDYTFEVIGTNNDNIWSDDPLSIDIKIKYPIWQKWYAFLFYIIIIQIIAFVIIKETMMRFKLKKEIIAERYKGEAQEQLYSEKMKFFTNISHEIRTPLTLVISPVENLLRKFQYDESTSQQLLTIKRNSSRLLRLTNQILDYRLLEVNKLKANLQRTDIIPICNDVIHCFDLHVKEKQMNLIFSSDYKELFIQVDPDMIEKIIYNLLSNALKFSNEKGQVFISIESKESEDENSDVFICAGKKIQGKQLEIKVRDFGRGINKKLQPSIMERFSTDPNGKETGSGIGLHLCNEYASLHEGNIMFTSEEGVGSTFILNLPFLENVEYKEKSIITQISFEGEADILKSDLVKSKGKKSVVLLAEDNDELRIYLKNYLQNYFKVVTAKNGLQAYEIAMEVIPDVIITDIMMPQMDGIELTQKLKNNRDTSRIPIVILTALSEIKYQKESLLKGVESYFTKPVDETLLLAQIQNILAKQAMMEKHFSKGNDSVEGAPKNGGSLIERAEKLVEENLQNANFDMTMLLELLNVSRSTFHRKIKLATNQSPSEFIRDIRLIYAVKIMKTGDLNIDEIGSYVGFNSTSYFIRSFKSKYGKTPKEYYNEFRASASN